MNQTRRNSGRLWLTPVAVLACLGLLVFTGIYALDLFLVDRVFEPTGGLISRYFNFDPEMLTDALPAFGTMLAAVLSIVLTVVSLIVQLVAGRYTGVTQMFLRDRLNMAVMAYFVIASICAVWMSVSLQQDFVPRAAVVAMMLLTSFSLVLMLPYFVYVFWFLEPENIIIRIRQNAFDAARRGRSASSPQAAASLQGPVITGMEELTDIASNSIGGKDKIIASRAVDALKDFALDYISIKPNREHAWYQIGDQIRTNPDFVAMDAEPLRDLEVRRTWVEWKVLRQYLGIYNEALPVMPDINYLVAIDTRYVGEAASERDDDEAVKLVFRFMNSYLRATLNAKNVRTAYNVLNQYRLFLESLLRRGKGNLAVEGVGYMNYYGHVSYDRNITFVTETVAYDIASLCQYARELGATEEEEKILEHFLELDQPLRAERQEKALVGVRKAQVKLAAYYLLIGDEEKARLIAEDMRHEPEKRLLAIRDQLERVISKDFWEIIDRGRNFEYMPPEQRAKMATFFDWLGVGEPRPGKRQDEIDPRSPPAEEDRGPPEPVE